MNRRTFLKNTSISTAALSFLASNKAVYSKEVSKPAKKTTRVPDTFDLAKHGAMAINGVIGSMDHNRKNFEISFLNILDVHPAYMLHWSTMVSGVQPKYIELLPLLRMMSGSEQDREIEKGFVDAMVRNMSEDGLVYDRSLDNRPWNTGVSYGRKGWDEDYANMAGNGRLLAGLTYWHQSTGEQKWKDLAKKNAERMLELAITEGDYAWYPNPGLGNDFSYPRVSGWTTKDPPGKTDEGYEGATTFYLCQPLRGFTRYYQLTGDERFLDLSRKFAKTAYQQKFWAAPHKWAKAKTDNFPPQASFERGHFQGHFHGNLAAIRALLDYAIVANDNQIKDWARNSYEYSRQMGIADLGLFVHGYDKKSIWNADTEGCTIADMIGLAVSLTNAGLGDYWDDVEKMARNGLTSAQSTDMEELKRVSNSGKHRPPYASWGGKFDSRFKGNNKGVLPGQEIHDRVLERTIGAFGHVHAARYLTPMMMHCCTANCSQALYYAWEGIIRRTGNSANVNMWMNRRSPWLDVYSSLPHKGTLQIQNKGMKQILVRLPAWSQFSKITFKVNNKNFKPTMRGNRVVFSGLKGNEQILLSSALVTEKSNSIMTCLNNPVNSYGEYECHLRGHQAVQVKLLSEDEGPAERNWYRIFRPYKVSQNNVPTKTQASYVHPAKLIRWHVI
jgi:hypothetical protein